MTARDPTSRSGSRTAAAARKGLTFPSVAVDGPDVSADTDAVVDVRALVEGQHEPRESRRVVATHRPRRWRWVLLGVALVAGIWGGLVAVSVLGARDDALAAGDALAEARVALFDLDLERAGAQLDTTLELLGRADGRLHAPPVAAARVLPFAARNLEVTSEIVGASIDVASAGRSVVTAVQALPQGSRSLLPAGGVLPAAALTELVAPLADAAQTLASAVERVEQTPAEGVLGEIHDAREAFLADAAPAAQQLDVLAEVVRGLPAMLGADGPRRYFVGASNPTEPRGTGGYIGAFTILELDQGRPAFGATMSTLDLPTVPASEVEAADPSLAARYDRYGGAGFWPNINMTPDFPSAATAIERLYEEIEGVTLDGVMVLDPYAFQELLALTGPVDVPGHGEVTADAVVDFVSNGAYDVITDPEQRKRLVGEVATAAFASLLRGAGALEPGAVVDALGRMASDQSLLVHATDPQVQASLVAAGVTGALPDVAGDLVAVTLNSGSASKVDYYLERTLRYDVELEEDGAVVGTLVAAFANHAPTQGQPRYVIGPNSTALEAGDSLNLVSSYCTAACEFLQLPGVGFDGNETEQELELGHPVASTWLLVPAGQEQELLWTQVVPDGWASVGADRVYRLTYLHQTAIRPTRLAVTVQLPPGFEPAELPEGFTAEGDHVSFDGVVDGDRTFEIRLTPR